MDTRSSGILRKPSRRARWVPLIGPPGPWSSTPGTWNNLGYSKAVTSKRGEYPFMWRLAKPGERGKRFGPWTRVRVRLKGPHLPPNGFSNYGVTGSCSSSTFGPPKGKAGYEYEGNLAAFMASVPPIQLFDPATLAKAANKLWEKASDPQFEGYLQFGEAVEAAQMLKNPLTSLRKLADLAHTAIRKKAKGKSGESLRKAVSSAWLEYQFGVRPLLEQTGEIVATLVEAVSPNCPSYKYEKGDFGWAEDLGSSRYTVGGINDRSLISDTKTLVVRGGFWLRSSNTPYQAAILKRLGIGDFRSIMSQAYALMPLSFAVDWFVGIGPLLKACRPSRGAVIQSWVTRTIIFKREIARFMAGGVPGNSYACLKRLQTDRATGIQPSGYLNQGPGLNSLNKAITAAALGSGILDNLWTKSKPWH